MSSAAATQLARPPISKGTPGIDPRTILVVGATLVAASSGWHWWNVQRDTRTPETIVAEYLLVAGLSVFVLALLYKFHTSLVVPNIHGVLLDAPAVVAMAVTIWLLGIRQFGGYDHSALIQAGWLQLRSLVPFQDYPCTFPPLFFLGARYAFRIFGVRWSAFVLLMAAFAFLSFLFLSRQFRALGFPSIGATTLAVTAEMGTSVASSYWWYNPVTSMVGVMVFVSALVCLAHAKEWTSWTLLGISFTLLVLSKPNAWPIGACVVFVCAAREASQRLRALTVLTLGVSLSGIVCWLHHLNPIGVLRAYSDIAATRGDPLRMTAMLQFQPVEQHILRWSIKVVAFLFFAILAANQDELRQYWREYSCCLATAFTSLALFNMNGELKTSDLAPLVVALAVVAFRPWSKKRLDGIGRAATVIVVVFFMILSGYWGVARQRVRGIGERVFFENAATAIIPTGFFAGLHTGPRLVAVLRQIEDALDKYPSNKVFFGPRMEFSYAAFRRDPLRGLPVWWDPGTSFAVSDVVTVNRALENADFDILVFLKGDRTLMPLAVLERKLSSYDRVSGFSELDVYVRRKGGETAAAVLP